MALPLLPDREFFIPWRDRRGRLCPVRIPALAIMLSPLLLLAWDVAMDQLGDLEELTHFTGRWSLRFLLVSLAITPIGRVLYWQKLYQTRRMIGLGALAWAGVHVLLYVIDHDGMLDRIIEEIVKRFYLTIGAVAVLGMVALAFTSTDGWIRYLGNGWKRLHRLVFPLTVLAVLHAVIQAKTDASEPLMMAGLLLWLVAWRLLPMPQALWLWVLAALSLAAGVATAGLEYLWYANFTRLPAARIFMANFDPDLAPRAALMVMLIPLGFLVLAACWRLVQRGRAA